MSSYSLLHDQLHPPPPPFGERSEISNSARASTVAWLPPTVYRVLEGVFESEGVIELARVYGSPPSSDWLE